MKAPLFEYPTYQYQIKDWEFKKKGLLKRIKEEKFVRTDLQTFETDRQTNKKSYLHYFQNLIKDELWEFVQEAQVTCSMTDCWASGIRKEISKPFTTIRVGGLLVFCMSNMILKVHTPTCFVAPWQDPRSDTTSLAYPQNVKEGTIFISPSYTLHFVHPNQVRKHRTIISFDLLPKLPDHQSV